MIVCCFDLKSFDFRKKREKQLCFNLRHYYDTLFEISRNCEDIKNYSGDKTINKESTEMRRKRKREKSVTDRSETLWKQKGGKKYQGIDKNRRI